ncbi:hypothetical protein [Xanthomonas campestris]|uniref:hypothetical protein n=1 Tax=Xanthomonas campestris TaxID=339 RepID=UPI001F44C60E|nr:hypothetical protein [Xanthomonas campestris]
MDHFEGVALDYLRADRALFVNSQCCIQLNEGANPDTSGPHWYCDAVAVSFKEQAAYLCEISYAARAPPLIARLKGWNEHWAGIRGPLSETAVCRWGGPSGLGCLCRRRTRSGCAPASQDLATFPAPASRF